MIRIPQNSPAAVPPDDDLVTCLAAVRRRMSAAADAAGRDVRSVTLLAVSKGQPVPRLRAALALGLTQFGENYVAEALPKIEALAATPATWHFIGRLQANKTRLVARYFSWVHGIDRLKVAERLSAQRPHAAPPLQVCVQVRVAEDPAKGGVEPAELMPLLQGMSALPGLRLRGLMCMLPFDMPREAQHAAFAQVRNLAGKAAAAGIALDTLSMGMSADLEAAVAEGATLLRIGTALFGARAPVE